MRNRNTHNIITEDERVEKFVKRLSIGFVIFIALILGLLLLGTSGGRFVVFSVATLGGVLYLLGWVGELAKKAYE